MLAFDWRGQGRSGRLGRAPFHGDARDFTPRINDLCAIAAYAGGAAPLVGVGHSMGGHLWLRALAAGETRVARVSMISPMLGIAGASHVVRVLSTATVALGRGRGFAFRQRAHLPCDEAAKRPAALTRDLARQTDEAWWLSRHPELALGGCTSGWLHAAFGSIAWLRAPDVLEAIRTPVLACLAGNERVTDTAAAIRAVERPPDGRYEIFGGVRHELLREVDAPREAVFARIAAFLEQA